VITIITFDQKTKKKGTSGVMGVWLKDESPPMLGVRPEITTIIEKAVMSLEGWWVPKKWTTDAGQELPTIFRNMGDLKTTRVSALPAPPPGSQPFHIGHLPLYCNPQLTPYECDMALEVLQLLVDEGKIKVIEVQEDWLLFLSAPYAEDTLKTIQLSGDAGLIPGESARDWVMGSSTLVFLRQMRTVVGQGIWLDYCVAGAKKALRTQEEEAAPQEHQQPGFRWYHTLAPLRATGFVSTKNVPLMAAAFTHPHAKEELERQPPLVVYNVGAQHALVLFENSVYTSVIDTRPLLVGRGLADTFEVPRVALEAFYASLCECAQNYLGRWKVQAGRIDEQNRGFLIEHDPTQSILEQQRKQGQRTLYLTRRQVRALIAAKRSELHFTAGLSIIVLENGDCLTPDPQGPGMLWMFGQAQAGEERQPINKCKMQWSIPLGAVEQEGKRDHGRTVRNFLEEEWPELAYGTRAAEMLATLSGMGRLIVVGVAEGYLIVTPEVIAQALMPDGRPQLATLEQQFGKGVQAGDFLEGCAEALPSLLVDDKTIEASVRIHSTKALNKEIAQVLTRSFVWKGVRVTASADGASGYQDEATLTQQLMNLNWLPAVTGEVDPSIDMQSAIKHPGGLDGRGPTRLLSTIASWSQNRPRMIPVGQDQRSILFLPRTTRDNFFAWDYNDPRFRRWQLGDENPLTQLARSTLTTDDDANPGADAMETASERSKTSGKGRGREEDEGTDQQSSTTEPSRTRKGKGKQRDAAHHTPAMTSPGTDASGGESTPVNMNDE
jgi:hypothetical protein